MPPRENPISPMGNTKPHLTFSAASINSEPVELESTPISPERLQRRGSKSAEEILSNPNTEDKKVRDDLMRDRKVDPAVLVDIPSGPDADAMQQAAGTTTTTGTKHVESTASTKNGAR